jgi:hypothetical protein
LRANGRPPSSKFQVSAVTPGFPQVVSQELPPKEFELGCWRGQFLWDVGEKEGTRQAGLFLSKSTVKCDQEATEIYVRP